MRVYKFRVIRECNHPDEDPVEFIVYAETERGAIGEVFQVSMKPPLGNLWRCSVVSVEALQPFPQLSPGCVFLDEEKP